MKKQNKKKQHFVVGFYTETQNRELLTDPDLMYVFEPQGTKVQILKRNFFNPNSSLQRILKGPTKGANRRTCRFADLTGGEI